VLPAIEQNFFQAEIADASFRYQAELERGERRVVGVNAYETEDDEVEIPILRIDPASEREQVARVKALRAGRDAAAAEAALARVREKAAGSTNLMPALIDAARADVTLGEICDALRAVWGVWRETPVF
jgi:methylmalonyl-CoA mutase N-terminal domain/subunit